MPSNKDSRCLLWQLVIGLLMLILRVWGKWPRSQVPSLPLRAWRPWRDHRCQLFSRGLFSCPRAIMSAFPLPKDMVFQVFILASQPALRSILGRKQSSDHGSRDFGFEFWFWQWSTLYLEQTAYLFLVPFFLSVRWAQFLTSTQSLKFTDCDVRGIPSRAHKHNPLAPSLTEPEIWSS